MNKHNDTFFAVHSGKQHTDRVRILSLIVLSFCTVTIFCFRSDLSADSNKSLILAPGQVGSIKLGMTPDDIYSAFGKDRTRLVDRQLEGTYSPAIELFKIAAKTGSPEIIFELNQDKIDRIEVRSPQYRTVKGIGVGSTVGDLRRIYGIKDPKQIIWGEEGFYGVDIPELRMSFGLDVNKTMNPTQIDDFDKTSDHGKIPDPIRINIVSVY
jgi:hypothetical protein